MATPANRGRTRRSRGVCRVAEPSLPTDARRASWGPRLWRQHFRGGFQLIHSPPERIGRELFGPSLPLERHRMIKTEHLSKRYDSLVAVDDVSFQVAPGEVLGFLGPNGAGKTTTMRMLAGFITPTAGKASICGHDIATEPMAAKASLGYLPEGAPSYGEMSVRSFLEFIADLRHLQGDQRRKRMDYVIGRLQLERVLQQTIETLSKGFRRRVGLAQAIIHDPPVLILDEPTDGLDPNQKFEVRTLINEMSKEKIIVISTT